MVWSLPTPPAVVKYRSRVTCLGGPADGQVLPVTAGSITVDRASDVRRSGTLTVAGVPQWTPDEATDALDPRAGTELLVEQVTAAGVWVPQGVFSVSRPRVSRAADGVRVQVEIDDRSHRVRLAGMDRRWVISQGTPVVEAIRSILTQIAPWCPSALTDTLDLVAADVLVEFGDDPWAACLDLAESIGMDLFVDPLGVVVWESATAALSATPVDVTWLSVDRDIDTAQIINHVRAEWSPARPDPVPKDFDDKGGFEDAIDDWSSTSVQSWVGRRCKVVKGDRSLLTSPSAAQQAAAVELLRAIDIAYSGQGTVTPDATLDVGSVTVLDGDRFRISRLQIDLAGGETQVTLGVPPDDLAALLARALTVPPDRRTREIVVSVSPLRTVLASDPTGSQVMVTPTAAVQGVNVGDVIEVLHTGKGERIGIARFLSGNAYARAVLADAPFCYFPLDETTGTPVDVQGAVTVSSMTGVTLGAAGIGDGFTAATVNGATGAGIVLPRAPFNGTARFTVEMLAKATDMTVQRYFFGMEGSGQALGFSLRHTATPSIDAYTGATWPNQIGSTINEAQPTAVHHWAITYDGTDAKLYRDGSQIASEAQTWTLTNPAVDLFVGGRPSNAGFLGAIAGFAFHKQALSAARILAHAQAAGVA